MKKILIVADGMTAKAFLQRVANLDAAGNRYYVVYYNDSTLPTQKSEHFFYYKFDPTSCTKLETMLEGFGFYQAFLLLSSKTDLLATYQNIRKTHKELPLVLLDRWNLEFDDPALTLINAHDTLSNILSNYLPDIPLFAQNLGLGTGEIMEMKIPFGSPYLYRHIANIEQKRWRIVAIFREHKLLLPTPKTMLLPNDSILTVGNPNVLKSVYKSINREFGQFPIPFGENIYCFVDMATMEDDRIEKLTNDAMLLHANLNSKKLLFRIVNPRYGKALEKLKKYNSGDKIVEIDFHSEPIEEVIFHDIEHYNIGLFITDQPFFTHYIKTLYELHIPIFKVGRVGFFNIRESVVLSDDLEKIEKISTIIFDIAAQLHLDIALFDFAESNREINVQVISHFENLAKLFQEQVRVLKSKKNPIRELSQRKNFLQYVPFDQKILEPRIFALFSTDIEKLYFKLSDCYQLFLPVD